MNKYPNITKGRSSKLLHLALVHQLIAELSSERSDAVMTTTDSQRRPHATWMGTLKVNSFENVIALTSPNSREIQNIVSNPQVEWMFSDSLKHRIVYLRGKTQIVHDPEEISAILSSIRDLSKAYFLSNRPHGMEFIALKTRITEVEYCAPQDNLFSVFDLSQVSKYLETARQNETLHNRHVARNSRLVEA